jgi:hypothetical protein
MTRFVRVTTLTVTLLATAEGCSRDRPNGNGSAATSAASVAPAAASVAIPRARKPGLTEPGVRELVGKWTAAQSTNDFASYEALYADRFTGVKRAGSLTVRQGRDDWMKDRKAMIAPGLVVEANDVSVAVTKDAATVSFVQHYKSPRFEDVGLKQLVVIATPVGPRIAREEMLSSAIQMQGLGRKLSGRLHVAQSGGVFLTPGVPANAVKGRLSLAKPDIVPVQEVDSAVDEAALSPDQRGFVGRTFTAYDAQGKACSTTVQSLSVKALVTPHFGTVQSFDDRSEYPDPAVAAQKRAETYFDLAGDAGRYLFGTFATPCPGARWSIEGTGVAVTPKGSGGDEQASITALHTVPQYRAIAADFAREHPERKGEVWEKYDGEVTFGVFRPEKGSPLLVLGARGGSGCGDFWGSMTAVFDVTHPAQPVSRGVADASPSVPNLLAAVDLDADGELEFISGPDGESADFALIRPGKKGVYVRDTFFTTPFLDCPC